MAPFARIPILVLALLLGATGAQSGTAWRLELPGQVEVQGQVVRLRDVASRPVPAAAGQLVLVGQGQPGTTVTLARATILRRLVEAGLAEGVSLHGSQAVKVVFTGRLVTAESLRAEIRRVVQDLVPPGRTGAPAPWFELDLPTTSLGVNGQPTVEVLRSNPLEPGRNQVRIGLVTDHGRQELAATVVLHFFGEVPTARLAVDRGVPLTEDLFDWAWLDLSELAGEVVAGRAALQGACAGRTLPAGERLRQADLKPLPVVKAGDTVDMQIQRGGLVVTVRALARQAGCLGQTIPVRNELNGRLVNARVSAPGLVEWRSQ